MVGVTNGMTAREQVISLLAKQNRSSLLLSKYVPSHSIDGWLALRGVAVETAKIADNAEDAKLAISKLEFWRDGVTRVSKMSLNELKKYPSSLKLLGTAVQQQKSAIHPRYLQTLVQSRQQQVMQPPINSLQDLQILGESTHSQLLYATLDMLQTKESGTPEFLSTNADLDELASEILAHIGQATGIASSLRALSFYVGKRHRLLLPSDLLMEHGLQHQTVMDFILNGFSAQNSQIAPKLADVVFAVATAANDHILTARQKMQQFRSEAGKSPPSLNITSMAAIPVALYLDRLQKNGFDLAKPVVEWRLPWRSWRGRKGDF